MVFRIISRNNWALLDRRQRSLFSQRPIAKDLPEDAVLTKFPIPFLREREYVHTYRIARRPEMAHAVVNAGLQ